MRAHRDRIREIAAWAIPEPGTPERARFDKYMSARKGDAAHQKELKETFERAKALVEIQGVNGLGFPADKQLREFNAEYNGRVFSGGLRDLPGSFNVVEAFNTFLPRSATFYIRDEKDFIFSFDDFIDFVTSELSDTQSTDFDTTMEEGKIYSFNSVDAQSQTKFSNDSGEQYEFSSASLVRFGHEVSMILLAGQECDLAAEAEKIKGKVEENVTPLPHRAHVKPADELELRAEPLFENSNLWKTVVLIRFDNRSKTVDARYLLRDAGKMYFIFSDDPESYIRPDGQFWNEQTEQVYKSAIESIGVHSALFELCKTCLLLPTYALHFESDIVVERHPTELLDFRKKVSNRKTVSLVPAKHLIAHREAFRIPARDQHSSTSSSFLPPDYRIETSGYWKRLGPRDVGRDKNGAVVHGRTWVSQTLSWVQDPTENQPLVATRSNRAPSSENSGFIYVMRSAAHEKNIFKIGLTRRTSDIRSAELSRSTSSPDQFLVVEDFAVSNCLVAERAIHQRLAEYRINPGREYFRAPYGVIRKAIQATLSELEADSKR